MSTAIVMRLLPQNAVPKGLAMLNAGNAVVPAFRFEGKSGKEWQLKVTDRRTACVLHLPHIGRV